MERVNAVDHCNLWNILDSREKCCRCVVLMGYSLQIDSLCHGGDTESKSNSMQSFNDITVLSGQPAL